MTTATATRKTSTRKPAAKKAAAPAVKPEPAAPAVEAKPLTRGQAVALLRERGYTGPVSYDMTTVRSILSWVEAGSPKDGPVPAGVIESVHPTAKPVKAKTKTRGYLAALADLRAMLDNGADLAAVTAWANDTEDAA